MKNLTTAWDTIAQFITRKEVGASMAEYGLLLALIAVACMAAIAALGTQISSALVAIAGSI